MNAIKVASDKGELYAIPYYAQIKALFYNKNLFDKFGVSYPRDGMIWEDTIELAKKMTRLDNGVQIQGLNYESITRISFPWSPNIVDTKTQPTFDMAGAHYIFVTKQSKNKDAAMKVIETLLSDEVQLMAAKFLSRQSPLKNPEIQKAFGTDFLKGVDMQSIFKSHPAPGTAFSKYYIEARNILNKQYDQVRDTDKNINAALRDAEEMINKLLEEKLAAEGKK